ncbi:unnamed protein product [Camellia sinensis]
MAYELHFISSIVEIDKLYYESSIIFVDYHFIDSVYMIGPSNRVHLFFLQLSVVKSINNLLCGMLCEPKCYKEPL